MVEDRLKIDPNVGHVLRLKIFFRFLGFRSIYIDERKIYGATGTAFLVKVKVKPR